MNLEKENAIVRLENARPRDEGMSKRDQVYEEKRRRREREVKKMMAMRDNVTNKILILHREPEMEPR